MSASRVLAHNERGTLQLMTNDKYAFLEESESPNTKRFLSTQVHRLHTALDRHPERVSIEGLVSGVLAAAAMDVPLSAGERSVFSYRPADQALPHCCWRGEPNGRLSDLAPSIRHNGRNKTPFPLAISTDGE